MKESAILTHIEQIADGRPSAETLAWLQAGFRDYLAGKPLGEASRPTHLKNQVNSLPQVEGVEILQCRKPK